MEVKIVEPYGYCFGVQRAIEIAKNARIAHPHEKVTILGMLAHNRHVIKELETYHIYCQEVVDLDYFKALACIDEGIVIFSAHGHDAALEKAALSKGLKIIDATCPFVSKTFLEIQKAITNNHSVIYIGKGKHPEAVAALSISPQIELFDVDNSVIDNKRLLNSPIVFNQTTLSYRELANVHQQILNAYPQAIIHDEICSTSRLRQQGIDTIATDTSLILVIGDPISNNTDSLYRLAKSKYPRAIIHKISSYEDINASILISHQKVALVSGASTPHAIVEEIAAYLKEK